MLRPPHITDFDFLTGRNKPDETREFDVVLPNGTQILGLESDDDVRRAKDLFGDQLAAALSAAGPASSLDLPILPLRAAAALAAKQAEQARAKPGHPVRDVMALFETEMRTRDKSVNGKLSAFAEFIKTS